MEELKRIFASKYYKTAHNRRADAFWEYLCRSEESGGMSYSELGEVNHILAVVLTDFEKHFETYRICILKLLSVCKMGFQKKKAFDDKIFKNDLVYFLDLLGTFFEILPNFAVRQNDEDSTHGKNFFYLFRIFYKST